MKTHNVPFSWGCRIKFLILIQARFQPQLKTVSTARSRCMFLFYHTACTVSLFFVSNTTHSFNLSRYCVISGAGTTFAYSLLQGKATEICNNKSETN